MRWLPPNPREIKRFINVYRFYAFIQYEREAAGLPAPWRYSPGSSVPVRSRLSFHRRCCTSGSYAAGWARVSVFRS